MKFNLTLTVPHEHIHALSVLGQLFRLMKVGMKNWNTARNAAGQETLTCLLTIEPANEKKVEKALTALKDAIPLLESGLTLVLVTETETRLEEAGVA